MRQVCGTAATCSAQLERAVVLPGATCSVLTPVWPGFHAAASPSSGVCCSPRARRHSGGLFPARRHRPIRPLIISPSINLLGQWWRNFVDCTCALHACRLYADPNKLCKERKRPKVPCDPADPTGPWLHPPVGAAPAFKTEKLKCIRTRAVPRTRPHLCRLSCRVRAQSCSPRLSPSGPGFSDRQADKFIAQRPQPDRKSLKRHQITPDDTHADFRLKTPCLSKPRVWRGPRQNTTVTALAQSSLFEAITVLLLMAVFQATSLPYNPLISVISNSPLHRTVLTLFNPYCVTITHRREGRPGSGRRLNIKCGEPRIPRRGAVLRGHGGDRGTSRAALIE
ncbi:hypothetical protein Bbelb_407350 [Branchiostoma belcheri]|nr:hypothetical protein Bbelb_407350 [Branchiostoma belcheri]